MKLLSVIIPSYNSAVFIAETLKSVEIQDIPDCEVLVIHDGSTDHSADLVETQFPWVRLIKTENQGPAKARSLGTQMSSGQYIQYVDADDLLRPGTLKKRLDVLIKNEGDVAYTDWQYLNEQPDGRFLAGPIMARRMEDVHPNPQIALFTDFWCPPAAYMYKRHIVERIGGWAEGFEVMEDVRFVNEVAMNGAKFFHVPGVGVDFRVSKASFSIRQRAVLTRHFYKNVITMESWWSSHGGIDEERRWALIHVYGQIARMTFETERVIFDLAYHALNRLKPGYVPDRPKYLAFCSRIFGYRNSETIALWYRKVKKFLSVGSK